jgi:hypothetical protein
MRVADLVTASMLALVGGIVVLDALRLGIGWGTDGHAAASSRSGCRWPCSPAR